jgi:predicted transcriptional regulator
MYPPCESISRFVLPLYRSFLAKELIEKYNFTQVEAAQKLGTTQAAISQYIHSKRGYKGISEREEILPLIQNEAAKTAKRIADEKIGINEIMLTFCKLCASFKDKGQS